MVASYPSALRWRVIYLVRDGWTTKEISETLHVSKTFVKKIKDLYRRTSSTNYPERHGRPRNLDARDLLLIKSIIERRPEMYESEIKEWIRQVTGKIIHESTIHRYLRKIGYTRRKASLLYYIFQLNVIARQRDEKRRANYRRIIAEFDSHQLMFIDESARDERTYQRRYANDLRGTGRISVKGNFTRGKRYSVLNAINNQGVQASHTIAGAFNREQFEFAMQHFIIPRVGSVPQKEPCSVVVMDNCNIHFSQVVFNAIRNKGGIAIFLP
ncbi:hypothetical protein QZH41_018481 [Actinostola sp. cb2023]|nr:hypothetical protein QZH41_018481 [Actinostola sp. cb2023]